MLQLLDLTDRQRAGRKPVKALAARPEDISLHQTLLGIFFSPVLRYLVITWPQTGGVCRSGFESPHRPATPQTLPAHRQAPHRQSGNPCSIESRDAVEHWLRPYSLAPRREAFRFAAFICAPCQWTLQRFNKLNGVANVAVHFHDHFDVGVLDPVCVDKIWHAKDDRGLFVLHRATSPSFWIPASTPRRSGAPK